jgi:hypothetical protein
MERDALIVSGGLYPGAAGAHRISGYLDALLAAFGRAPVARSVRPASQPLVEPLIVREREVLLLLARGRNTREKWPCPGATLLNHRFTLAEESLPETLAACVERS